MTTDSVDHESALRLIHTGKFLAGMPTWGSWVVYALGTENQNLPAYVVLVRSRRLAGRRRTQLVQRLAAGGLSGNGVPLGQRAGAQPEDAGGGHVPGPRQPASLSRRTQPCALETGIPATPSWKRGSPTSRSPRRMQTAVPEALDLSRRVKSDAAHVRPRQPGDPRIRHALPARPPPGRARRAVCSDLSERPALGHAQQERREPQRLCAKTDQPSAALVRDLKQRGLLDSTIVMWTGEFGRLPIAQGTDGRDHNRHGFSLWLAGGGFKAGYVHGATDDFGYRAVDGTVSVHDLQATLFRALGLDHRKLTYPHEGRLESLTDAEVTKAKVASELLA